MSREGVFRFVAEECKKLPPDRGAEVTGKGDVMLRCPYHSGGLENTPSFKINCDTTSAYPPGLCYCWACKVSLDWNSFAKLFGLGRISGRKMAQATRDDLYLKRLEETGDSLVPDLEQMKAWPAEIPWRRVPGKTVTRLGGCSIRIGSQPMLYLPALIYGEHVGGIQCRLSRDRNNKKEKAYINTTGDWSAAALFGFDHAARKTNKPLWIVEGPRDTAWVAAHGARVVGLIGSAVTKRKLDLIRDLDPPAILVATDPDDPGDKAARLLFEALEDYFPMKRYPFKPEQDPAKLQPERIKRVCAMMEKFGD